MPWVHVPRHCQLPEVSDLVIGSSRTGWPPGGEGEGKVGSQWGDRGLLGKKLAMTPVPLQGDPGPPGKPVSDAAQQVHLCLPQPQERERWAVPSMVSFASPLGSQCGWCWREGNLGPAVPSTLWEWLWAGEEDCTVGFILVPGLVVHSSSGEKNGRFGVLILSAPG